MKPVFVALVLAALLAATGCAGLETGRQAPKVNLIDLTPMASTVFEQQFKLRLRLTNPDPRPISVSGFSFDLFVNEQPFASGVGKQDVQLDGFSEAEISVVGRSTVMSFLRQIKELADKDRQAFTFRLAGKLGLGGFSSMNVEEKGALEFNPNRDSFTSLTAPGTNSTGSTGSGKSRGN